MAKVIWDTPDTAAKPDQAAPGQSNKVIWDQPAQTTQQGAQAQTQATVSPPKDDFWTNFWADPNNMKGLGAGLAQGVLDPVEGLVQLGLWPVVGRTSQDWLPGLRQAATGKMGAAGEFIGSALPFLLQPELGIGQGIGTMARFVPRMLGATPETVSSVGNFMRGLYNIGQRSTLPAVAQPKDPEHMGRDLGEQALLGTLFGEGVRGAGVLGGKLLERFSKQDMADWINALRSKRFMKETTKADQRQQIADYENMVTNEQMMKNYRQMEQAALAKGAASEMARRGALQSQAQIPRNMIDRVYDLVTGLGRVGKPRDIEHYRAPALTQHAVGQQLDGIYARMKLDTNNRAMTMGLPAKAEEIAQKMEGLPVPGLKNEWTDLYNRLIAHRFNQGVITGKELQNYLSSLRNNINSLGMQAQQGRVGARDLANGLREMLYDIEGVADSFDENAAKLGQDRKRINMAYELASRLVEATDGGRKPLPSPTQFLDAWKEADGERHFGRDTKWVELKTWMQKLEREHTKEIPGPVPPVMPKQPTPFPPPEITKPTEPKPLVGPRDRPPESSGPLGETVGALSGLAAHGHGLYPGFAARIGRTLTHTLPNLVPRPVAKAASKIPPYAPAATAGASHAMTPPRPLWIIRGPRGEDLGLANTNDPRYLMDKPPGSHYERSQ